MYVDPATHDAYWYFTYTVTNRTGKDQLWAPSMVLFTDTGEILQAGRDVPTQITESLLKLLGNTLMQDQNDVIGDILQGKENAKEGLVIWPARNTKVNELSLSSPASVARLLASRIPERQRAHTAENAPAGLPRSR
jgi:hypothetical protein